MTTLVLLVLTMPIHPLWLALFGSVVPALVWYVAGVAAQVEPSPGPSAGTRTLEDELADLRRENAELRTELELLRAASRFWES